MEGIYDLLAPYYGVFNRGVDYEAMADYAVGIFRDFAPFPVDLVLDLGCGTGGMTFPLYRRGYNMIGVDGSVGMLAVAREEEEKSGARDILWLAQDMISFDLYGTVEAVVCTMDGLNHLFRYKDLRRCLSLVHTFLVPDGLFLFDLNGRRKFETQYADRSYTFEDPDGDAFCVWQNDYDAQKHVCDFTIDLFRRQRDGTYERQTEIQRERMYTVRAMKYALKNAGFHVLGVYRDLARHPGTDEDERLYWVAKAIKEKAIME